MKNIKFLLFVIIAASVLFACKKKDKVQPTVAGYWIGKYGNSSDAPSKFYAFLFRTGGTVRVYSNIADTATANKAEGTYNVSGTTVTTTYKYLPGLTEQYSTTATADAGFTTMSGTWGSGVNTSGGGTFNLTKQ